MRIGICLLLFAWLSSHLSANAHNPVDTAVLAQDPHWQALLHINHGATLRRRGTSYVRDPAFFLSGNREDAAAELAATIRMLAEKQSPERCRFPARYRFVADALGWEEAEPLSHCREYQTWRAQVPDEEVVMVFPAAYLNSPSSMFGHTLLRFDRAEQPSDWHAWAVNFGALVDADDTSILYIYRGLAGGYPGRFSTVPYVNKIQEYSHMENRDMWEYRLGLTRTEINRMLDHLWELKDIEFAYYFLDENCSFRLLELIEAGRPSLNLLEDYRFAEIPVNTVRALERRDLIVERHYRPSKAIELKHLAGQLSAREQSLAAQLMKTPAVSREPGYTSLPAERQQLAARVAYRAVRYNNRVGERDPETARISMALLHLIRTTGDNGASHHPTTIIQPAAPELGHPTKMIAASGGALDGDGFGELQFRLTYHDWLDNPHGFKSGAWIEALNFRLRRAGSERVKLWAFDLVNIRSMAPRSRFVKPVSWQVNAGIDRPVVKERRGATVFVDGGAGLSWDLAGWRPYTYALARAEHNDDQNDFINPGAGAEAGLLRHFRLASVNLSARSLYFADDAYRHRYSAAVQLPLGRRNGVRVSVNHEDFRGGRDTQWMVSWRHYFD